MRGWGNKLLVANRFQNWFVSIVTTWATLKFLGTLQLNVRINRRESEISFNFCRPDCWSTSILHIVGQVKKRS